MKPSPSFPPSHLVFRKAELAAHWHAFLDFDRADRRTSGAACLAYRATSVGELFWAFYLRLHDELRVAAKLASVACLALVLAACGGAPFTGLSESIPTSASDAASDAASDSPSTPSSDSAPATTSALPDGAGEAGLVGDGGWMLPPCACSGDLSGVGIGDFTISLAIAIEAAPKAPGYFPLADQKRTCDAQNPGWELSVVSGGELAMQIYDGSNVFDNVHTSARVDDGRPHWVVVRRLGGSGSVIEVSVDGAVERFAGQPPEDLSGQLSTMQTRVEPVCAGNAAAPSEPTQGTVQGLCVAAGACELVP